MAKAKVKPKKRKSKQHLVMDETIEARHRREATDKNFIRAWRILKGVEKQEDLAKLTVEIDPDGVGLLRETISRLETGLLQYNERHLTLIGKVLGVTPLQLIGQNPFKQPAFFFIYSNLSLEKKKKLEKMAKALAE